MDSLFFCKEVEHWAFILCVYCGRSLVFLVHSARNLRAQISSRMESSEARGIRIEQLRKILGELCVQAIVLIEWCQHLLEVNSVGYVRYAAFMASCMAVKHLGDEIRMNYWDKLHHEPHRKHSYKIICT